MVDQARPRRVRRDETAYSESTPLMEARFVGRGSRASQRPGTALFGHTAGPAIGDRAGRMPVAQTRSQPRLSQIAAAGARRRQGKR